MELTSILTEDLSLTLTTSFSSDKSFEKFHRNGHVTVDERVKREITDLNEIPNLRIYEVYDLYGSFVGYFGIDRNIILCTFFIMPDFRFNKVEVWNFMISHLPKPFFAGTMDFNFRAVKFLESRGGKEITKIPKEKGSALIFMFQEDVW